MTAMEAHLRGISRHTFREVRRRTAKRQQEIARSDDGCQWLLKDPDTGQRVECGQLVTHTGVPPNYLRYCERHADHLKAQGKALYRVRDLEAEAIAARRKSLSPAACEDPSNPPAATPTRAGAVSPAAPCATLSDPDERSPE